MISKIELNNVPSYKEQAVLETDKKVNLIYGLNGTGKTILSNVLYKLEENEVCIIKGFDPSCEMMLVYNQKFIEDNFFEPEEQNGIFTLSRENKETRKKINELEKKIQNLKEKRKEIEKKLNTEKESLDKKEKEAENEVWNIKIKYTGGDRVLEYCLEGYKGSKDKLFRQLREIVKPIVNPQENIESLKVKLQSISGDKAKKLDELGEITFSSPSVETETLLSKQIVGNENSTISQLIKKLKNDDWVKTGVKYLPKEPIKENASCPFCQEKTISIKLIESIKSYFDDSYEADIDSLNTFSEEYSGRVQSIPKKEIFESCPKFEQYKNNFEIKYNTFINLIKGNKGKIEDKINSPSKSVILENSSEILKELNEIIQKINNLVATHNENVDNLVAVKDGIKETFWQIMRWNYDQIITRFNSEKVSSNKKREQLNKEIEKYDLEIKEKEESLPVLYQQTKNIQEAIYNINNGLSNLGITNFEVIPADDDMYRIARKESEKSKEKVFSTLSEGEKMIISFLYFIEQCKGKKEATETKNKKIIVIDDPISSLSHIYVFNISQLIYNEFFNSKPPYNSYEQVFILTHSLYFFNELIKLSNKNPKKPKKLFRLIKNTDGSFFDEMRCDEVQNEYQAYWSIIKDDRQPEALIANCMRNIVEYFFAFVANKKLSDLFNSTGTLTDKRFQAFYRYMNRESHSDSNNLYDFKEFDYKIFKDGLKELFKETGFGDHYNKMIQE